MKIKKLFSRRVTSLLLVFLLAFTMLPTGAFSAEVTGEAHVHTEECSHGESVETLVVAEDETVVLSAAETYEIASDTEVTEVTEGTTEAATETDTAENATSGFIKESSVEWSYNSSAGRLIISGSGDCTEFTSADDQPLIAYRNQITEVWFYDMDALSISNIAYWFDGCSTLTIVFDTGVAIVVMTSARVTCQKITHLATAYVPSAVMTMVAVEVVIQVVEQLLVITIPPTTPGPDAPTMNTVPTAETILVPV